MTYAPHATQSAIDGSEPAPRHSLSVAPDPIRCQRIITQKDGTTGRCSRFGILLPDGARDRWCISHSSHRHAVRTRRRGVRAQRAAERAEREHLEWVMNQVAPEPPQTVEDLRLARHILKKLVVLGEISVAKSRELRAILDAEEATLLRAPGQYLQ